MQRRSMTLAVTLVALAATGIFAPVSLAAPAVNTSTPYEANYTDENFGPVHCEGHHQTNSNLYPGTETEGGRDKFKCQSTVPNTPPLTGTKPLTGVSPEQTFVIPGFANGWNSDYSGQPAIESPQGDPAFSAVVSKNGKAYSAVAYY